MEGVLDEDYNAVLDTAATTAALENDTLRTENDDSKSISSTASHKKPLYKRAWRKVYKTVTAPEKDASGQRMSLRDSISMRLSRDPSVSSSSSSFFTGMYTPRSARHPAASRSEFALSETHTAPLPRSSGSSPIRGSRSHAPYSVENAVPLPLPTGTEPQRKPDSARELQPSPEASTATAGPAAPPLVPALRKTDMSLTQLAGRTSEPHDTVTPVTSARYGASSDSPATDSDIPASTPQFSAALLVQGEAKRSLQSDSAHGESLQSVMPNRQPDWPAGSSDEPTTKRPHLPPGPPQEASEGTLEKLPEGTVSTSGATGVEAKQPSRWRRHSATSPPNSNGRSVSKLKHLHPPSRDSSAVKQAEVTHAEFERKMREGEPQKPQFVANAPQVPSRRVHDKPAQPSPPPFGSDHPNLTSPLQASPHAPQHSPVDTISSTTPAGAAKNASAVPSSMPHTTTHPLTATAGPLPSDGLPKNAVPSAEEVSAAVLPVEHNVAARALAQDEAPAAKMEGLQAATQPSPSEPTSIGPSAPPDTSTAALAPNTAEPPMSQPPEPYATDPEVPTAKPDRHTSPSSLSSPAAEAVPTVSTVPAVSGSENNAAQDATASPTETDSSHSAGSETSMPNVQPVQTHLSQMSSIPVTGSGSLTVGGGSAPVDPMQSLQSLQSQPNTPVLYCESPRLPDNLDTENVHTEGSEASSGAFFVAKDALSSKSGKDNTRGGAVARSAMVKSPLSELSQQLHTQGSVNSSSIIDHGSSASAAAAAAAELQAVSVELPDSSPPHCAHSSQPDMPPPTDTHAADLRRDLPLSASVGAIVGDPNVQDRGSEAQSTSVNAVDVRGKADQGATVKLDADMEDDVADSGPRGNWAQDAAARVSAGGPDSLEHNVRELVSALEGRLTTTGTLEGALSGTGQGEGVFVATDSNVPASGTGDSIVPTVNRSESIGSTSGVGNYAGGSSVSARDVIETYEASQPRSRHIFSPSPTTSPEKPGRSESASMIQTEASPDTPTKDAPKVKKRGGIVRTVVKAAAVAAVGAGAAFAVARVR